MAGGTVTDPRFIAITAVGLDWQATEGETTPVPAFTPDQFIVVQTLDRDPDPTYLEPAGTHGSHFMRGDGNRIISQAFKKELKFWGGRFQMLPFLESAMSGQPTVAFADLTITGPQSANIDALSFIGARPGHNSSKFDKSPAAVPTYYVELVGAGFPFVVNIYSDAARTILVATAAAVPVTTPTALVASGSSGLTGSVTLGAGAAAGNADAVIDKVTMAFGNQFVRFFRLYYSDGDETVVLEDCVVQELVFESEENGELSVTASVMARRRTPFAAQTLTIPETQLDLVPYSHSELVATRDPLGSPSTPVVDGFSFRIENNVLQYIGNCPTPQKLIKRGFTALGGTVRGESADETFALVADARANTAVAGGFAAMRYDYILSTRTLRFEMNQVRHRLQEPGIEEELVGKTDLEYDALYDGITDPVAVTVDL